MLSEEKINDKKYFYSVQLFDPKNADLIIELKPPRQCLDGFYMSVVRCGRLLRWLFYQTVASKHLVYLFECGLNLGFGVGGHEAEAYECVVGSHSR